MSAALDAEAAREVVAVLRVAEQALGLPAETQTFHLHRRSLQRADGVPGLGTSGVPDNHLRRPALPDDAPVVELSCASGAVVVGKFSRETQVKARGYLVLEGRPVTLKVWRMRGGETQLGVREREMRLRVASVSDYRAPEVLAHGRAGEVDYLLEPVVLGRHPATDSERLAAARDLVPSLVRAYATSGRRNRRLSKVVPRDLVPRLEAVLDDAVLWPLPDEERASLRRFLLDLVRRDDRLPTSVAHGDLVATNIVRRDDGHHVLIDWEHARELPVAFDLGKLLLTAGGDAEVTRAAGVAVAATGRSSGRSYTWEEQLLLGLSAGWPRRPSVAHGRGGPVGRSGSSPRSPSRSTTPGGWRTPAPGGDGQSARGA